MAEATSGIGTFLGGNVETPERRPGNEMMIYAGVAAVVLVVLLFAMKK